MSAPALSDNNSSLSVIGQNYLAQEIAQDTTQFMPINITSPLLTSTCVPKK